MREAKGFHCVISIWDGTTANGWHMLAHVHTAMNGSSTTRFYYVLFNSEVLLELTHIIPVDQAASSTAQIQKIKVTRSVDSGTKCCQVTPLELEGGSSNSLTPGDFLKHNHCPCNFTINYIIYHN